MDIFKVIDALLKIILFLYADPILPRKIVVVIIQMFRNFLLDTFLPELKKNLLKEIGFEFEKKIDRVLSRNKNF